ncbi:hypothetical protein ACE5IS_09605 [Leptospira wolffii]|uniref:Uncharacterized protein n=1 Tax=Leptospira wolffii TaxID=409998 RepID=A0A2M9ZE63_9LEPT|nr:hypothetical protein [Leptospira wolffii]EPG65402.1 hypothetical protein LEP1GSC061_2653 [Leptospira wolffii serovar Khorat str. Khorat-H2]PJZ66731.1 hypothetical protein CH371_01085 [Leptospira wolffii]
MNAATKEQILKHTRIIGKYRNHDRLFDTTPDWMDDVLEVIYSQDEFLADRPDIDLDIE